MAIKRYSSDELIEKCTDVFFNYMVNSPTFFFNGETVDCDENYPTPTDYVHKQKLDVLEENRNRLEVFTEALNENKEDEAVLNIIKEQCDYLVEEQKILLESNMENQKKLYEKTGKTDYTRTAVSIPLDKKINSYYDDLILDVIFYDDVTVINGKYDEYKKLPKEEKLDFLKKNVEITHLGLSIFSNKRHIATIGLLGKLNFEDPRVTSNNVTLLKHNYSDFSNLSLKETLEIGNNDLRQLLQSKIDLDKENMTLLAEKNVRGDNYKVFKSPTIKGTKSELYIRYICPSTGRVYYNTLDLRNLELSEYYKEGNYNSYIDSWWSLTHLGTPVKGEAIIRC